MRNIKIQNKDYKLKATHEYGSQVFDPNIELICNFIRDLKISKGIIVDIGANQGIISVLLKDNIPNTGIVCIEPAVENVDHIKYNVPGTTIYQLALSNVNFTGSLIGSGGNQCYKIDTSTQGDILVSTLDSLDIKNVMLIKIDVETHEIEVLEGAINTIQKYKPIIYLEHHAEVNKDILFDKIEKLNYKIIYVNDLNRYIPNIINTYILIPNN